MARAGQGRAASLETVATRRRPWKQLSSTAGQVHTAVVYHLAELAATWSPTLPEDLVEVDRVVDRELGSGTDPLRRPQFAVRIAAPLGAGLPGRGISARAELEAIDAGTRGRLAQYDETERRTVADLDAAATSTDAAESAPAARSKPPATRAPFDLLVVPNLAHICTEPARLARALAALVGAGVHLWCVEDDIDTRRSRGRGAVRGILRAAYHAATARRRRTLALHDAKRAAGRPWTRRLWGLVEQPDGSLALDPAAAALAAEILQKDAAGESPRAIAQALNRAGRRKGAGLWRSADVRYILQHRELYGAGDREKR